MRDYQSRYRNGRFRAQAQAFLSSETCNPRPIPPAPVRVSPPPPPPIASLDARTTPAGTRAPVLASGQAPGAFQAFRDCADCVEMVALPGGTFTMGSPAGEAGRGSDEDQVSVTLPGFAISRFPVTRGEYAAFVAATGRATQGGCYTDRVTKGSWAVDAAGTWRDPAFAQTDRHPVVCVDWADAEAYARWMKQRTGQDYRLISEAEYEYANRGGRQSTYFWGTDGNTGCAYANGADATLKRAFPDKTWSFASCDDGYERTSPVGAFSANPFGLFDITGNVWSWTADCYVSSYGSNPRNGQPNTTGGCAYRVIRGGSWYDNPQFLRSANRHGYAPTVRINYVGFRLSRTL
jgi:formylglycine-generating enzyme required for sulfatase activity